MKVMKNDFFFDLSIIFMKQIQIVIFEEMQDNYNALERNGLSLCFYFFSFLLKPIYRRGRFRPSER